MIYFLLPHRGFLDDKSRIVVRKTIFISKCNAGESLQETIQVSKNLLLNGTMHLSMKKYSSFSSKRIFTATLRMSKSKILQFLIKKSISRDPMCSVSQKKASILSLLTPQSFLFREMIEFTTVNLFFQYVTDHL